MSEKRGEQGTDIDDADAALELDEPVAWGEIGALSNEAERLKKAGKLTRAKMLELLGEALEAVPESRADVAVRVTEDFERILR